MNGKIIQQNGPTEVDGFYLIFPFKDRPHTAYVANLDDAKRYLSTHQERYRIYFKIGTGIPFKCQNLKTLGVKRWNWKFKVWEWPA